MDDRALTLEAYVADGSLRIALSGGLVDGTTARLRTWMQAHVPRTAGRLVLDLSGLNEIDAVGLGALLAAHRRLDEGAQVLVDGASPEVARVLRQAGLDRVLLPAQRRGSEDTPAPA